jgi:PmbA protein
LQELDSLASLALKKAVKKGVEQVEAFILKSHMRSVYIEGGSPRLADDKSETGLGLKLCLGKRVGFASGTLNKEKNVEEIVNEAFSIAKTSEEDPYFKSFPNAEEIHGEVKDVFSKETARISMEEIVAKAMETVKAAEEAKNVKVPLGMFRLANYSLHVTNSLGVEFNHEGTMVFTYFTAKATIGDKAGEGVEREWSTRIAAIDFEKMGKSIAKKALATLKAESFKGELKGIALIDPVEASGLLSVIDFASSSEQVNKGRSPWINKLETVVAGKEFTVEDDGRYPGGIRSALADDEGVRTSRKAIIEKGVLKSYIYDSYNAGIAGAKAAGNGFRRGTRSIEGSFTRPAVCAYSNMIIKPRKKTPEEIISQIDKGVLVETFAAPEVNPITGGFSCEVRNATLIEKGQLTKHVKHALLTGNMYELLKNVVYVGNDAKIVDSFVLPTIAFEGATLVG